MNPTDVTSQRVLRLRIVTSDLAERKGEEIRVEDGVATIGRDERCTIVLADGAVSRRHARVELVPEGVKLVDLDSSNGTWIGAQRVGEKVLEAGQQFRVGSTVFECAVEEAEPAVEEPEEPADADRTVVIRADAAAMPRPAESARAPRGMRLRIDYSPSRGVEEIELGRRSVLLGRGEDCAVVIDEPSVSRQHARLEVRPDGFLVNDAGSTNGTWVDGTRIQRPTLIRDGQRFRVGDSVEVSGEALGTTASRVRVREGAPAAAAQPSAPAAEATAAPEASGAPAEIEIAADQTVAIPSSMVLIEQTKLLESEGESIDVHSSRPFLADDPESVWYVVEGGIDLFTVAVKGGQPSGTRAHFLGINEGQCFFGFDLAAMGLGSGFLAVPKPKTKLRKIPLARLRELAGNPRTAGAVGTIVDTWVGGLSRSLTRDVPRPDRQDVVLQDGETVSLELQQGATGGEEVVWIDVWSGSILFIDMATPVFSGRTGLLPMTSDTWLQPVGDEFGDQSLEPRATRRLVDDDAIWEGLEIFHQVLCECEFINKKLAAVDEFIRLQDKAEHAEQAREAAYDAIGSVLRTEAGTPREFLQTGSSEPAFLACRLVGEAMGFEVKNHPGADDDLTYEEQLQAIASASGFRIRVVALRGEWWQEDHGPLLGQLEEGDVPVALLPTSPSSYDVVNPQDGTREPVDEEVAEGLAGFAQALYAPFPDGPLTAKQVLRFGIRGLGKEFRTLVIMGIAVGLLGAATPLITGKIFDQAIPQAERSLLIVFGLALFGAALSTSAFKIVQAVATLRVQGKMEYAIQAALWDRLMNLPANFFRDYSAGDLADRAAGIDQIQTLMSGAGVAAILGSFSGLFYVAVMLRYNWRLAAVAVVLTFTYVGVTMFGNYMQLRHQRVEIKLRGRIVGLVLNLITGVTKLRNSGAEDHAFRTWAQRFAEQRKIAFSIGRIQNAVTVFSNGFQILSSLIIFYFMWSFQEAAAGTGETVLSTGEFIAFNSAFGLFLAAMQALGEASLSLLRVVPIYERLEPIVTTPAEVDATKVYPGKISGKIEMSRVSFRYTDDGPWIIKDMSLTIEPGEMVAFVGGSGCGKSTVMRLMLGFEHPQAGAIYYDGQDMGNLDLRQLRQQMGVVLQVSRVMPTDIYRNIVGVSSRSLDEAWEAAEAAGIADDISIMPMKMHTYVSEGGGTLSGGQRQRLLIARAIVNKPKVIYLDEATSALDNQAQATVTESMDRMEATRVVIAHRLSTIINADKICYLEGGNIAEMGTYQELMEKDGLFAALAKRQMI